MTAHWTEAFQFLLAPFIMCLILAGIHCYLGLHVLARGVIFVDLSLAQVAALGATVAILFGFEHHSIQTYFISLGRRSWRLHFLHLRVNTKSFFRRKRSLELSTHWRPHRLFWLLIEPRMAQNI